MRLLKLAVVYTALALGANIAIADTAALSDLREGDMRKLVFHGEPRAVSQQVFTRPEGTEHVLGDWQGKIVLVNFWATWCAPCRKEMPGLDQLQAELSGDAFEVVTIASGPNSLAAINRFFEEEQIDDLPVLLDPRSELARDMGVFGLPVTVILTPDGREIARMQGEADWLSDSARAILAALLSD